MLSVSITVMPGNGTSITTSILVVTSILSWPRLLPLLSKAAYELSTCVQILGVQPHAVLLGPVLHS